MNFLAGVQPAEPEASAAVTAVAEAPSDMIELFNSSLSKNSAVFVIFYRGKW